MRRLLPLLVVPALLAAACGGSDDDAGTAGTDGTAAAATDQPAPDEGVTEESTGGVTGDLPVATIAAAEGIVAADGPLSQDHTRDPVEYPSLPPVGGEHYPGWQACGYYTVAVEDERAVHSLEHGAVWIAYTPGTDLGELPDSAAAADHLLLTPYDGLPAPIVASAWGLQLQVQTADDPALLAFIAANRGNGPEPGAPCVEGGQGVPPTDSGGPLE